MNGKRNETEAYVTAELNAQATDIAAHLCADAVVVFASQGENTLASIVGHSESFDRRKVAAQLRAVVEYIESGADFEMVPWD
jgi:hypothetical protein